MLTRRLPLSVTLAGLAILGAAETEPLPPVATEPSSATDFPDDLSQFNDLPVVVSGSRGKRHINESPVPISIVTGEDIRLGGYTTVAEALSFTPGMDVAPADRTHWQVGVRGLHEVYSDRTLTMVDGVVADHPLYGGSQFPRLPIAIEDLDHVEVVRGPGGAAWGANAFNGVINLISAKPEDSLGTRVGLTVNDFGDLSTNARWGDFAGPISWRMTVGYQEQQSSADILGKPSSGAAYMPNAYDDAQRVMGNGDLTWHAGSTTEVRFGLGYSYNEEGAFSTLGVGSEQTARERLMRASTTIDQGLSDAASIHLTGYVNYSDGYDPALLHHRTGEYGLEAQLDLALGGGHQTSIGAGLRLTHIDVIDHGDPEAFVLDEEPITEVRYGLFVIDHWQISTPFSLETQVRGDQYSGTGTDWAGRVAALYACDHDRDHILRIAAARAYRTPLVSIREAHTDRFDGGLGFGPLVHYNGQDVDNEHTWTGEIGWTSQFEPGIVFRFDAFYQHYDDLIGYVTSSLSPPLTIFPENLGGAEMYGIETELAYSNRHGRWGGWYAWHDFSTEDDDQSVRAFHPTESSVGATSRWNLPLSLIGIINYRFSDLANAKENNLAPFHRLDLALNWRFPSNRGEIGVGCHDVLNETYEVDVLGSFSKNEVPGRTFFIRGELTF